MAACSGTSLLSPVPTAQRVQLGSHLFVFNAGWRRGGLAEHHYEAQAPGGSPGRARRLPSLGTPRASSLSRVISAGPWGQGIPPRGQEGRMPLCDSGRSSPWGVSMGRGDWGEGASQPVGGRGSPCPCSPDGTGLGLEAGDEPPWLPRRALLLFSSREILYIILPARPARRPSLLATGSSAQRPPPSSPLRSGCLSLASGRAQPPPPRAPRAPLLPGSRPPPPPSPARPGGPGRRIPLVPSQPALRPPGPAPPGRPPPAPPSAGSRR